MQNAEIDPSGQEMTTKAQADAVTGIWLSITLKTAKAWHEEES